MARVPRSDAQFLDWARAHADLWLGNGTPPPIGLTPEQAAAVEALTTTAESEFANQQATQTAAEGATITKRQAFALLRETIGAALSTIDAFAKATADPGVYALAGIPEPKPAAPRIDPPTPTDVAVSLRSDGGVEFRFKAAAGGGAVFLVERQTADATGTLGQFEHIGQADDRKRFIDQDTPAGVRLINYRARTRLTNGELSQWSETATIRFGVGGEQVPLTIAA